jgi:diketogulonate reductase-like aldo/keto reductase
MLVVILNQQASAYRPVHHPTSILGVNMNAKDYLLSANQIKMPRLIYGTAWKKDQTASLVKQAIKNGFRGIDTACQPKHYHEAGVGEAITSCLNDNIVARSELYLQTKFTPLNGQDPERIPYNPTAPLADQVFQSFKASLKNLNTPYLDGLILHSPLADLQDLMTVWQAMEQLFQNQGVRQLGISNCYNLDTLQYLYQNANVKPAVLQNRFYAATHFDRALRDFCQQNRIIYQSFWTLTANPEVLNDPVVKNLGQKYRCNSAQVFFRFLTQSGIIPLTGTTSEQHMREDLAIFDFALTADECKSIDDLLI